MQNNKHLFAFSCGAMWLANMSQAYLRGANSTAHMISYSLGVTLVSIPIWILVGGYIILQLILALINLVKPENKIKIDYWGIASYGLLIGVLLKLVFNIKI